MFLIFPFIFFTNLIWFSKVVSLLDVLDNNSLFPPLNSDYQQYNIMFRGIENLDASCFYGRSLGFQVNFFLFLIFFFSSHLLSLGFFVLSD